MIDFVFPNRNELEFKEMADKLGLEIIFAYVTPKSKGIKTVRAKNNRTIVIMRNPKDVRAAIEKFRPDIIFETEKTGKADFLHQRNSGLNHIICRAAQEKKVAIGFSSSLLLSDTPGIMGRMNQNIRLCRKFKVPMVIASLASDPYMMRSPMDIKSLFVTVGMHPSEAENAMIHADIINRNRHDGVEII